MFIQLRDCERNIFRYIGGYNSTPLVWNLRVRFFRQIQITDKVVQYLLVLINGVQMRNNLL